MSYGIFYHYPFNESQDKYPFVSFPIKMKPNIMCRKWRESPYFDDPIFPPPPQKPTEPKLEPFDGVISGYPTRKTPNYFTKNGLQTFGGAALVLGIILSINGIPMPNLFATSIFAITMATTLFWLLDLNQSNTEYEYAMKEHSKQLQAYNKKME